MIKQEGVLHVPSMGDEELDISSPVTAATYISHLNDARSALQDPNHQVSFFTADLLFTY